MRRSILLIINGQSFKIEGEQHPIPIKEDDKLQISVIDASENDQPEIFIEDHSTPVEFRVKEDGSVLYETAQSPFFRESFGYAEIRIQFAEDFLNIPFDVMARKTSVDQAQKMICYLASHSESLIKSCLARSSIAVGVIRSEDSDPETLLDCAENFIEMLQVSKLELLNNLRERLTPVKLPLWQTNKINCEVDPYEILNNLDALTPSSTIGDVFINGRHFSLGGIDVSSLQPTSDVQENRILLGGLYSIRNRVGILSDSLSEFEKNKHTVIRSDGYETFSVLMLSLTSGGMLRRCSDILDSTVEFIKLFEQRLKVNFKGEIHPVMTPYARSSRVYRALFTKLSYWYELGQPSLNGVNFLMKLKSLAIIYELFSLFHLLEYLIEKGWEIVKVLPHDSLGEYVPSVISFTLGEAQLTVTYEPTVGLWNTSTEHLSLIDIQHNSSSYHPYWTPDFVFRMEINSTVRYLILDAKYSTAGSVKTYHIPELFRKYYLGMAVYDANIGIATHNNIVGVFAIYSLGSGEEGYIPQSSQRCIERDCNGEIYGLNSRLHGLNGSLPRIPMVGGIGLMVDNTRTFTESMDTAIKVLRKTISNGESILT